MEGVGENRISLFPFFFGGGGTRLNLKTPEKSVGKCAKDAESVRFGDIVTDQVRTTPVHARGNPGKDPVQFCSGPLLTDLFWPEPQFGDRRLQTLGFCANASRSRRHPEMGFQPKLAVDLFAETFIRVGDGMCSV